MVSSERPHHFSQSIYQYFNTNYIKTQNMTILSVVTYLSSQEQLFNTNVKQKSIKLCTLLHVKQSWESTKLSRLHIVSLSVLFVFRSLILPMHVCMLCIDCILSQHCTLCQFMRIKPITCLIYFSACHFQQVLWSKQHYMPTRCV